MAAGAKIYEDSSGLSYWDLQLFRLETLMALLGGLAIFSLMLLAVLSVGGRNIFSTPLSGYVDIIEQLMPLIAYAGLAYCHRLGGHVRMDFIINRLPLRLVWLLEIILSLLIMLLTIALIWGSFEHFMRSFDFAAPLWSRDSSLDIAIPLWPMKLLIPIVFSLFLIRLSLHLWGYIRAFISYPDTPIAIPMPESIVDIAAREAEQVGSSSAKVPR